MTIATGGSLRARLSNNIDLVGPLTLPRLAFLVTLGVLTIVLHETFHYPLKLPGHHGLEGMALLALGRLSCTNRWAASIVALSTAATALATGAEHDLASAALNIAPGVVMDLAVLLFSNWRTQILVLPLIAGIAHATKPIIRWGLTETMGMHFGSLRSGVLFPLCTHLAYGFTGALIAVLLWRTMITRLSKPSSGKVPPQTPMS